jgi:hypothetical protein
MYGLEDHFLCFIHVNNARNIATTLKHDLKIDWVKKQWMVSGRNANCTEEWQHHP